MPLFYQGQPHSASLDLVHRLVIEPTDADGFEALHGTVFPANSTVHTIVPIKRNLATDLVSKHSE